MYILQRVKKWLAISLDIREEIITPESTLSELFRQRPQPSLEAFSRSPDSIIGSLSPDSLDIVELVMSLEEEFSLEIPDEEIANLPPLVFDTNTTVAQIVRFIEKNAQA